MLTELIKRPSTLATPLSYSEPPILSSSAGPPAKLYRLLQLPRLQGGGAAGQLFGLLPAQWLLRTGQQQRTRPFVQVSRCGTEDQLS